MHNDNETKPSGLTGAIFWIAIAFSCFQLITAAFSPLSSQVVRATPRGGQPGAAPAITAAQTPPAVAAPAAADQIGFVGSSINVPQ